jgi:hypothetical protein
MPMLATLFGAETACGSCSTSVAPHSSLLGVWTLFSPPSLLELSLLGVGAPALGSSGVATCFVGRVAVVAV